MLRELPLHLSWATCLLVVGAVSAAAVPVWLAFILRSRGGGPRSLRQKVEARSGHAQADDIDLMLNWLPRDSIGERRSAPRRGGPATAVRVARSKDFDRSATAAGLVLDRSPGGVCVAVEHPFREGEGAFLRVEASGPDSPWVAVAVRNCRDCGDHFLLGCEFAEGLTLGDRLQFG